MTVHRPTLLSVGRKRLQTQLQKIDVMCMYIDMATTNLVNNDTIYVAYDFSSNPITFQSSALASWFGSTFVSPIGDTSATRDKIGNHVYIGAGKWFTRIYYDTTQTNIGVSGSSTTRYTTYPTIWIAITNDGEWFPMFYNEVVWLDSTAWAVSEPTTTQYGLLYHNNYNGGGAISYPVVNNWRTISEDLKGAEIEEESDPYQNAGETEEGGGSGSFDYTGDTIPEPSLPTIGAAATGFVSLFNPSATQLQSLIDYLWSPLFDIDTVKRLYADPMQQFIGLSLVPVPVPSGGTKTIQVGGVSTGITLTAASAQFVSVDCGSITFNSSSLTASYLDFLPYTKTQLYLPYIGIVDVSTDDIMDKTISVKYHVDILTGGCIAYIIVGGSVMYQYSGQCAINIPLSSIDWSTTISSALNLVSSAIGGIISGASVPLTGGAGALVGAQGIANMGASAVNAAVNAKPTISKSGAIGGSSGIMAVQKPYLIVTCPNLARAKKQDYFLGYPSFINKTVANCSGFCSFEEIYLSGLGLTDEEMEELTAIMKEGVYL